MTPTALTDGTRTVTASVSDPAGNEGTDSQAADGRHDRTRA